ncbi:DUF418 domain-containing protein [Sphingobium sp. CR28]|uniref:DUF418 domain-containing protein n=1 Tax=Sphingobium sp. CR28 TaxID=3400272 RepID=UPI003FED4FBE
MPKSRSRKRGGPPRRPASTSPVANAMRPKQAAPDASSGSSTLPDRGSSGPVVDRAGSGGSSPAIPFPVLPPEEESERIEALDFLRGLAVIGILVANVAAFGLPSIASINPFAWGMSSGVDIAAWLFTFLFVDGKMRALFAIMFGASMLLVMEAAETRGQDGLAMHQRRMWTLIPIGLAHYLLLWDGDILLQLAFAGLIGTRLARLDQLALLKWGLGFIAAQWVFVMLSVLPPFWMRSAAEAGGTSLSVWQAYADALGVAPSAAVAKDVALHQSGYVALVTDRLLHIADMAAGAVRFSLLETLGFMAFGMAMLKGGFLSGQWTPAQYRATWLRSWAVGLVPMAGLAAWILSSGDPLAAQASILGWSLPLRLPLAVGHAALAMLLCDGLVRGWLRDAVIAVGRLALSAYLFTSLIMTTLFYGYGAALYGTLGRAPLLAIAAGATGLLLLLCWGWRRTFGQGPVERLWRLAARGRG